MRPALARTLVLGAAALIGACEKAPFTDINARFELADLTWFEDEQTLFVFYRVSADQGLGPDSTLELSYRTDDRQLPWTPLDQLEPVHVHEAVDCGPTQRCGSLSVKVERPPRQVGLRLRFHRSGQLSLLAAPVMNFVSTGPAHLSRSFAVYGVFDETNTQVQWRGRHRFPTITNPEATALGLRRQFRVENVSYGDLVVPGDNPHGYAVSPICPVDFTDLPGPAVTTLTRAFFEGQPLPLQASAIGVVCASSTVTDAVGTFTTAAVARKNPQVRPAFPSLRTPIRTARQVGFVLRPCQREISAVHLEMQRQRLLLTGAPEICLDDFRDPSFTTTLLSTFTSRLDAARVVGDDLVLMLALHHDDTTGVLRSTLEGVLERVLVSERTKPSPRVVGAFVFDSTAHRLGRESLKRLLLWCRPPAPRPPPFVDMYEPGISRECPTAPDLPPLMLGPFSFSQLPILPMRDEFNTFVEKYTVAQTGFMKTITVLAPQYSSVTETVPDGEFGLVTMFNDALITAAPTDGFSFCPEHEPELVSQVRFRTTGVGPTQLGNLPLVHAASPSPTYTLGLTWESPFLVRAEYEERVSIAATVATFTVPFGIASQEEKYLGATRWLKDSFPIGGALVQCTRYCDHPTFDSAGQYQPLEPFSAYAVRCFTPRYPSVEAPAAEKDFPLDL